MFTMSGFNATTCKQPLKVFCALTIKPEANWRSNNRVEEINAHRRMHTQRNIEGFSTQFIANVLICPPPFGFIEDDKLDIRDIRHELSFCLTDNPCDTCAWPVILNTAHNGQCMTRITDRGKANDTYFFWLRF